MCARLPSPFALLALALLSCITAAFSPDTVMLARQPEQPSMTLEWPEMLRQNEAGVVMLTVPAIANADALFADNNVMAVARLELAGMDSDRAEIHQPIGPTSAAGFRWKVLADRSGQFHGTVWLHLEVTPRSGGENREVVLLASPIEIRVVPVLGLSVQAAVFLGSAGLLFSFLLGAPALWPRLSVGARRFAAFLIPRGGAPG